MLCTAQGDRVPRLPCFSCPQQWRMLSSTLPGSVRERAGGMCGSAERGAGRDANNLLVGQ